MRTSLSSVGRRRAAENPFHSGRISSVLAVVLGKVGLSGSWGRDLKLVLPAVGSAVVLAS